MPISSQDDLQYMIKSELVFQHAANAYLPRQNQLLPLTSCASIVGNSITSDKGQ